MNTPWMKYVKQKKPFTAKLASFGSAIRIYKLKLKLKLTISITLTILTGTMMINKDLPYRSSGHSYLELSSCGVEKHIEGFLSHISLVRGDG